MEENVTKSLDLISVLVYQVGQDSIVEQVWNLTLSIYTSHELISSQNIYSPFYLYRLMVYNRGWFITDTTRLHAINNVDI